MISISMSTYFYPEDFIPPNIGDIIYHPQRVIKKVKEIEKNSVALETIAGRVYHLSFLEYNKLAKDPETKVFANEKLLPKKLYCAIDQDNVRHVVFVKSIGVTVEMYFKEMPNRRYPYEDKINVYGTTWYKAKIENPNLFFYTNVNVSKQPVRWPRKILSTDTEIQKVIKPIIAQAVTDNFGPMSSIQKLNVVNMAANKILYCIKNNIQPDRQYKCSPSKCSLEELYNGNYNIVTSSLGNMYRFDLDLLNFEYIFPKVKKSIVVDSLVNYIGHKINYPCINEYTWKVKAIYKSKDNPALDQCTIVNKSLQYMVFRKELKLIKTKEIYEERI
jgi:hypothetical protein